MDDKKDNNKDRNKDNNEEGNRDLKEDRNNAAAQTSRMHGGNQALLVALARGGDPQAFAELVRRKQRSLRTLMYRCCGDPHLADDLAQQALLQTWKDIAKLRDVHRFDAWLKKLAVNTWLKHQRKHARANALESAVDAEAAAPDQIALGLDLNLALQTLPGVVRLCIVLSYHEGLSHGEIAGLCELPLGTVKSHIRRGTEQLKSVLQAYGGQPPGDEV